MTSTIFNIWTDDEEKQTKEWYDIYDEMVQDMEVHGVEDIDGDYLIDGDNYGTLQHKIYIQNLDLLQPQVIKTLQTLLKRFPRWEIICVVYSKLVQENAPPLWLNIRAHEVIDDVNRKYLPSQYRDILYEGGRPPTKDELVFYGSG